jgi:quercetin dioxygenase-like cupin family protein
MRLRIAAACAAIGTLLCVGLEPATAETMATPVLNTAIEGMPDTEANIVLFDVDPGWKTDHHIHPGQLFVYMLEGTLHLDIDGQEPIDYTAGEAFYELPNVGMTGANMSTTERAKFVVFQFGATGAPLMVSQ